MMEKEREALTVEIKKVFADMPYPRHIGDPSDVADLIGKQWHELSVNDVFSNYNFFLLSDEGFRYLLPGYLVVMLQNPEQMAGGFILKGILEQLNQEYPGWPKRDLCKLFDKKQRQTIRKFLNMFEGLWLDSGDIEKGISKLHPKRRDWARKEMEKGRREYLDLLEKAKQYWQACK